VVLVCGEALIDVVKTADGRQRATAGGGPFNTARALARLGVPTAFLARLSSDALGRQLASLLVADGVDIDLASIGDEPTTTATAVIDDEGRAAYDFAVEGTSAPNLTLDMLPRRLGASVQAIHLGSLGLALEPIASTLEELVRREGHGRLVMMDPNVRSGLRPDDEYRAHLLNVAALSTVVKGSREDLEWLYPGPGHRRAAAHLIDAGVTLVVVTLGEHGAYAVHRQHHVTVDAFPVEVSDTIGAGDAFGAGLLAWLYEHDLVRPDLVMNEEELTAGLRYASAAAARRLVSGPSVV
jgi:fructokinase